MVEASEGVAKRSRLVLLHVWERLKGGDVAAHVGIGVDPLRLCPEALPLMVLVDIAVRHTCAAILCLYYRVIGRVEFKGHNVSDRDVRQLLWHKFEGSRSDLHVVNLRYARCAWCGRSI